MTNYLDEEIGDFKKENEELEVAISRKLNNFYEKLTKCENHFLKKLKYNKQIQKWEIEDKIIEKGKDISGCYVLSYNEIDMYVGISRGVFKRIRGHQIVKKDDKDKDKELKYKTATFNKKMNKYQSKFPERNEINNFPKDFKFRYVEINDNYLLAMFEIYASMKLKTFWNSFKTH